MSLKKLVLASLFVVFTSAGYCYLFIPTAEANKPISFNVPTSEFTGYGPVDRVINIKIKEDEVAKNDKDVVKIRTQISMPFDFDENLDYKWILTENIQIKEGQLNGQIKNLKAKHSITVEISVTGFSTVANRQIIFQVSGFKNGRRVFADGIIASQKESTFEDIVQNVEKIRAAKSQEEDN
ncbi:MAG: hypothetical protein H7256_13945 [Bdellovibrio sp.]|nr:hypothetical protein [Bdellovibrio sp.]